MGVQRLTGEASNFEEDENHESMLGLDVEKDVTVADRVIHFVAL